MAKLIVTHSHVRACKCECRGMAAAKVKTWHMPKLIPKDSHVRDGSGMQAWM